MKHPVKMKLIAFHLVKAYDFDQQTLCLGELQCVSLLLMFEGKGTETEVLVPIAGKNLSLENIRVHVEKDDDIDGLMWVRLLYADGSPATVVVGQNFTWDTGMPFSLN